MITWILIIVPSVLFLGVIITGYIVTCKKMSKKKQNNQKIKQNRRKILKYQDTIMSKINFDEPNNHCCEKINETSQTEEINPINNDVEIALNESKPQIVEKVQENKQLEKGEELKDTLFNKRDKKSRNHHQPKKSKKDDEKIKTGKYAKLSEKEIFSKGGHGPGRGPRGALQFKEKPKDFKGALKRIFKYLGTNKVYLIMLFIVVVISTLISLLGPVLQGNAINAIKQGNMSKLTKTLILLFSVYVGIALIELVSNLLSAHLSQNMVRKMRKDTFDKLIYLPISYFDKNNHGDIMSKVTNDVDNISNTVSQSLTSLISGVITVIGALVIMLVYSPLLTLISLATLGLTFISTKILSKKMRKFFRIQRSLIGEINAQVEEMVVGHKTVKAFCKEQDVENEFNEISNGLRKYGFKAELFGGIMGPMMNVINNLSYLLVVAFGALFVTKGINGLEVGVIITFASLSRQFSRPINTIANLYTQIQTSIAAAERVFELLDTKPEINEGTKTIKDLDKKQIIEFKNVNFAYVPGEMVLKNFNLTVKPGEKIALVGATGSGKTTIVNLLMRFYDVTSGEILIGGVNINDIEKHELRSLIAIVLQDTVLFKDTILNNIKYGRLNATKKEVVAASKLSNSNYFIDRLSNEYDTVLTESGSNLSGGQRQLLSIARAVLANPKILILDEATSSVDTRTEKNIQDGLVALMKNRTSLIIAHRLSTIRDADKIVVIDHGQIVEMGNHDELIKNEGVYYKLYQTQFAGNAI